MMTKINELKTNSKQMQQTFFNLDQPHVSQCQQLINEVDKQKENWRRCWSGTHLKTTYLKYKNALLWYVIPSGADRGKKNLPDHFYVFCTKKK